MKFMGIFQTTSTFASAGLIVAAGLFGAATCATAQESISVPSGLCGWNWASPATDGLLANLAARNDFNRNMGHLAANCPQVLCDCDWSGAGGQAALARLGRGIYFDKLVGTLGDACPEVALVMSEGATATIGRGPAADTPQPNARNASVQAEPDDDDDDGCCDRHHGKNRKGDRDTDRRGNGDRPGRDPSQFGYRPR